MCVCVRACVCVTGQQHPFGNAQTPSKQMRLSCRRKQSEAVKSESLRERMGASARY